VICSAPIMDGWYRAQVTAVYEGPDECDIKYVDTDMGSCLDPHINSKEDA
jgi:hypothetical protein